MNNFPKKWFFMDPSKKESIFTLYHITNKDGVIFFNNELDINHLLLKKTEKLMNYCRINNISFLFPNSLSKAIKYKACGIYLPLPKYSECTRNKLALINIPKNMIVATSAHNHREIVVSNKLNYNIVFISPAFTTMSHKDMTPHETIKFINLCKLPNATVYALGGINKKNFQLLKNKHLNGFGAITYFKNQTRKL
jgi:thiamine monophosphate synthase